jgi:hypothetical protein
VFRLEIVKSIYIYTIPIIVIFGLYLCALVISKLYTEKLTHRENKLLALIFIFCFGQIVGNVAHFVSIYYPLYSDIAISMLLKISVVGLMFTMYMGWRLYISQQKRNYKYPNDIIYKLIEM